MSIAEAQFNHLNNQDCWIWDFEKKKTFWDRNTVCMGQFLLFPTLFLQKLLHLPYLAGLWRSKYLRNQASRFSKFSLYFAKIKMKVKNFLFWQNSALFSRKLCWLSLCSVLDFIVALFGLQNMQIFFSKTPTDDCKPIIIG